MIERFRIGEKEVILVGTAHISKQSVDLVEETISAEKPDVVGVELDSERLHQILSGTKWQQMNVVEVIKSGKTNLFLISLLLSNMQKQLGKSVGINPGAEMMAAVKKAQENKYQKICENIKLKKSDNLLEIGSGWGGFAIYAARKFGCKITTVTISRAQYNYALKKIKKEKLNHLIDIQFKDYRDLGGKYDKIVSIEMMEALGYAYVPLFIKKCSELVKSDGKICYQCITYPDKYYKKYQKNTNYIGKHIFPGGELLSLAQIKKESVKNSLKVINIDSIGKDYAKTLKIWRKNFLSKKQEILKLGFDEKFFKKWIYYFVYCEVGFETNYIDDLQITLSKD